MDKARYNEVLKLGCGWEASSGEDTDGDCGHGYEWGCDNCPIVIERFRKDTTSNGEKK